MKEQLNVRIDPSLGHRLRVYAAISDQHIADVVSAALDGHLPSLAALVSNPSSVAGLHVSTDFHPGVTTKLRADI
jgi:hypothetical protein